jgi:hypothetical protein
MARSRRNQSAGMFPSQSLDKLPPIDLVKAYKERMAAQRLGPKNVSAPKPLDKSLMDALRVMDVIDTQLRRIDTRAGTGIGSERLKRLFSMFVGRAFPVLPNRERVAQFREGTDNLRREMSAMPNKIAEINESYQISLRDLELRYRSNTLTDAEYEASKSGIEDTRLDAASLIRYEWVEAFRTHLREYGAELVESTSLSGETSYRVSQSRTRAVRDRLVKEGGPLYRMHLARLGEIRVLLSVTRKPDEREALQQMEADTKELVDLLEEAVWFQIGVSDEDVLRIAALLKRLETPQIQYDISQYSEERIFQSDEWRRGREELREKVKTGTLNALNLVGISKNLSVGGVVRGVLAIGSMSANLVRAARNVPSRIREVGSFGRTAGREVRSLMQQMGAGPRALLRSLSRSRVADPGGSLSNTSGMFSNDIGIDQPSVAQPVQTANVVDAPDEIDPLLSPTSTSPIPPDRPTADRSPSSTLTIRPPDTDESPLEMGPEEPFDNKSLAGLNKRLVKISRQISTGFSTLTKRVSECCASKNTSTSKAKVTSAVLDDQQIADADAESDLFREQVELLRAIAASVGARPSIKKSSDVEPMFKATSLIERLTQGIRDFFPEMVGAAAAWKLLKGKVGSLAAAALSMAKSAGSKVLSAGKTLMGAAAARLAPAALSVARVVKGLAPSAILGFLGDSIAGMLGLGDNIDDEALSKQDDANWERMTTSEKIESGLARAIESLGGLFGLGNLVKETRDKRVKTETEYLDKAQPKPVSATSTVSKPPVETAPTDERSFLLFSDAPRPSRAGTRAVSNTSTAEVKTTPAIPSDFDPVAAREILAFNAGRTPSSSVPSAPSPTPVQAAPAVRPTMAVGAQPISESGMYTLRGAATMVGVDPGFRQRFVSAVQEYKQRGGKKPVNINRAFATREEQERLYKSKPPGYAARPGSSLHEYGFAIDIDSQAAGEMDRMGILSKHGLTRPMRHEPWHIQPVGISLAMAKKGVYSADAPINQGYRPSEMAQTSAESAPSLPSSTPQHSTKVSTSDGGTPAQVAYEPRTQPTQAESGGTEYVHKGKGEVNGRPSGNGVTSIPTFSFLDPGMMILNVGAIS